MKIFTGTQIKQLDSYTIEHEPVSSIDLMERAARAITRAITDICGPQTPLVVFAGPGNNGGDALAVARMLAEQGYQLKAYLFNIHDKISDDCATNKQRLIDTKKVSDFTEVTEEFDPPQLGPETVVIDGLFGTGLNKPLQGGFASLVKYINASPAKVISIDLPSGLMAEDNTMNIRPNIIKADYTLTLQTMKLSFLLADIQQYIGELKVLDIKLSKEGMEMMPADYTLTEKSDITAMMKKRSPFAHKGNMGNALLVAGSYGMAGAAVLATKACMRTGAGKVTLFTPRRNNDIVQISVPEAIVKLDRDEGYISDPIDSTDFDAVGIGPGIGQKETTAIALMSQIRRANGPLVLDADALNILGTHRAWLEQLPKETILTPHPLELERLTNVHNMNSYERLSRARELAQHLQSYVILKGHFSALCQPDGKVVFNSTGNPGMATAGSGDVLTGIITGLLARGYQRDAACIVGMYLHGLAGDIAAEEVGEESLIASDIIAALPKAFKTLC